jgi:hypothetical protein
MSYTVKLRGADEITERELQNENILDYNLNLKIHPNVGHKIYSNSLAHGRVFRIEEIIHTISDGTYIDCILIVKYVTQ